MKEHLINLIYLQFQQEKQLAKIYKEEDGDTDIYDVYVDVIAIVLAIIGYPKEDEDIGSIKN